MTPEERLDRALAARAAPAKDLHFTLQVMREAEAKRYRADMLRRLVWGAALAAAAAVVLVPMTEWVADNGDAFLDAALAVGGVAGLMSLSRRVTRRLPARPR